MTVSRDCVHLRDDIYRVMSWDALRRAFNHWIKLNFKFKHVPKDFGLYLLNGDFEEDGTFPGVFAFFRESKDPSVVPVYRYNDGIPSEKFKAGYRLPKLPESLPQADHLGEDIYVVYDQPGVASAYYHYLAHNCVCSCPLRDVKVLSFPALLTFHIEGGADMAWKAVPLPTNFNGTVEQLAKQIITKPT